MGVLVQEAGAGAIMQEGERWQAGPGMSLERADAAGDGGGGEGGGEGQPVVVELVTGEPLNWLEALTF